MTTTTTTGERTAPVLDAAHEPAAPNIAPRHSPGAALPAAGPAAGKSELVRALAKAVLDCQPAAKDGYNKHHEYRYATGESIIDAARKALGANGLALIHLEASLDGSERDGPDRFELRRTILLAHSSGESMPLRVVWPVIPDRGRPLDKALAAADTLSLAYLLRDLLLMPRVDPTDEVGGRDDRAVPPQPGKAKKADPRPPADGAELEAKILAGDASYSRKGLFPAGALVAHMAAWARAQGLPPEMVRWPADQIPAALHAAKDFRVAAQAAAGKPAAPAEAADPAADRIGRLDVQALEAELARTGYEALDVRTHLGLPSSATLPGLTRAQYAAIMAQLKDAPTAPAKQ